MPERDDSPQALPGKATTLEATITRIAWLSVAAAFLFLILIWTIDLEQRMPDVRAPRDFSSSEILPGQTIMAPGYRSVTGLDVDLRGDWLTQEIGDSVWLATDEPGSQLRAVFYGTDVYLLARVGPDAGLAYVEINGQPAEHLLQDEDGAYVNLWAGEASDQPILLVDDLAHGEHVVEITAGEEGEIAISGFEVVAATPFPWAFLLAYVGIGGGLFLIVRQILFTVSRPDSDRDPAAAPDLNAPD